MVTRNCVLTPDVIRYDQKSAVAGSPKPATASGPHELCAQTCGPRNQENSAFLPTADLTITKNYLNIERMRARCTASIRFEQNPAGYLRCKKMRGQAWLARRSKTICGLI